MLGKSAPPVLPSPRRFEMASPTEHNYGHDDIVLQLGAEAKSDMFNPYERTLGRTAATFLGWGDAVEDEAHPFHSRAVQAANEATDQLRTMRFRFPDEYARTLGVIGLEDKEVLEPAEARTFLESRQEELDKAQAEHGEQLETWKGELLTALNWAAKHGLDVDLERAKIRLEQISVRVFDSSVYRSGERYASTTLASHNNQRDEARIGIERFREGTGEARESYFHELLHGLGGLRLKHWIRNNEIERDLHAQGFTHLGGAHTQMHMEWLEEATVEQLVQVLAHYEEIEAAWDTEVQGPLDLGALTPVEFLTLGDLHQRGVYRRERFFTFGALRQIPVEERPIQMLWDAFSEDYQGSAREPGQRNIAHKRFFSALNARVNLPAVDRRYRRVHEYGLEEPKQFLLARKLKPSDKDELQADRVTRVRQKRTRDHARTAKNIERFKNPKWHHKFGDVVRRRQRPKK